MHGLRLGRFQVLLGADAIDRVPVDRPDADLSRLPHVPKDLASVSLGLVEPALNASEPEVPLRVRLGIH